MKNIAKPVALQWIASMSVPALFVDGGGYSLMLKMLKRYSNRGISIIIAITMVFYTSMLGLTTVQAQPTNTESSESYTEEKSFLTESDTLASFTDSPSDNAETPDTTIESVDDESADTVYADEETSEQNNKTDAEDNADNSDTSADIESIFIVRDDVIFTWTTRLEQMPLDIQGDSLEYFAMENADNQFSDLGKFLEYVEVYDENGDLITEETFKPGGTYKVKFRFSEFSTENEFMFRQATEQELHDLGVPDDVIQDGPWMFFKLGDGLSIDGGTESDNGDIKFLEDGKTVLVKYKSDESGRPMDSVELEFNATFTENEDQDGYGMVEGADIGSWKPEAAKEPYVQKIAKYNPETHQIEYKVTLTNPYGEPITDFNLSDIFTDSEEGYIPKLVDGSVEVNGEPLSSEQYSNSDGNLSFSGIGPIPGHGSIEVTYVLDVSEQMGEFDKTDSFFVDNTVTFSGTVNEQPFSDTDDTSTELKRGKLEKFGYGRTTYWSLEGHFIQWSINVYDPYGSLGELVLTDTLPEGVSFEDIVGVVFCEYVDGKYTPIKSYQNVPESQTLGQIFDFFTYVDGEIQFDFNKMPQELKDIIFKSGDHNLYIKLVTKMPDAGDYTNIVDATLPSETEQREAKADVHVSDDSIIVQKSGHLGEDGRHIEYEVTMNVAAGIPDETTGYFKGGAWFEDKMWVMLDGDQTHHYLNTHEAVEIHSIVATYTDEEGSEQQWEFTQGDTALPEHKFGVYHVSEYGNATDENAHLRVLKEEDNIYSLTTAIVLNPEEYDFQRPEGWSVKAVKGKWPEELNRYDVKLTMTYSLNMEKAYFMTGSARTPLEECNTLMQYHNKKESFVANNYINGAIKDTHSSSEYKLNLVNYPIKESDVHVDLSSGEKYISYTIRYDNGDQNDGRIPRGADNIVFHDTFDERMVYVPGSFSVSRNNVDTSTRTFTYSSTIDGNTIEIPWTEFVDEDGTSMQEDFNSTVTGDYVYVFSYDVKPGNNMPEDTTKLDVRNEVWMTFGNGNYETAHAVTVDEFPSGILTKRATLEEGKVSFYIEINEQELDLNPDGQTLTIRDDPTNEQKYLQFVPGSLSVEKFEEGTWVELTQGPETDKWQQVEMADNGSFKIIVPDQMHLRIWCQFELTEEGRHSSLNSQIDNHVIIEENPEFTDGGHYEFSASDITSSADSNSAEFVIKKIETGIPDTTIAGARFILYARGSTAGIDAELMEKAKAEAQQYGLEPEMMYEGYSYMAVDIYETTSNGTIMVSWDRLKKNTTYLLVESKAPDGYVRLEDIFAIKVDDNNNIKIIGNENDRVYADGNNLIVENSKSDTGITVTKYVDGPNSDTTRDWHFTVTLSDTGINGTFGDMTFTDGVAEFTLKHGETKTADGLPSGITYTVTESEANQDGYETSMTGDSGTISGDVESTAVFTNTLVPVVIPDTGGPGVTKILIVSVLIIIVGLFMVVVGTLDIFSTKQSRKHRKVP